MFKKRNLWDFEEYYFMIIMVLLITLIVAVAVVTNFFKIDKLHRNSIFVSKFHIHFYFPNVLQFYVLTISLLALISDHGEWRSVDTLSLWIPMGYLQYLVDFGAYTKLLL